MGTFLLGSALSCGGSGTGTAKSADDASESTASSNDGASESGDSSAEAAESAPDACADGGCIHCGKGICPEGFYCDESAPGGPSCGWLPACADSPSCSCIEKALGSGCQCTERDGGHAVTCG